MSEWTRGLVVVAAAALTVCALAPDAAAQAWGLRPRTPVAQFPAPLSGQATAAPHPTARAKDKIFVLPVEFADYSHNRIPSPDRSVDNSTVWTADYSPAYYQRQIFGTGSGAAGGSGDTLNAYYRRQSSGAYTITGTVHDWTRVGHPLAHYGTDTCKKQGKPISTYYCNQRLVTDGLNRWYEDQRAAGRSADSLRTYLATYDTWDRHDHDRDGDFDEPDGYLDRVMLMFAGESQVNGGGVNGSDAIGSHRGTVSHLQTGAGELGPAGGRKGGGSEVGDSGIWVDDYTMTNENRGLGTLAHEYGHDLGLPDLYDTSGAENSTGFWSVMGQGSLLSDDDELAVHPGDLGAWARLRLGWLDHVTVKAGASSTVTLNPLSVPSGTAGPEALLVNLPADADGNARYYLVENRQYVGEDRFLKSGPFQLGWAPGRSRLKERLHYERGVLIWYWNTKYRDNKTRANGGYGRILPIDAHAEPARTASGAVIRGRLQAYDAPFGLRPTSPLVFHLGGVRTVIPARPGVPVFDDLKGVHHYDAAPYGSSHDADSGTTITVDEEHADGRVKVSVGSTG
ncbi:immune inhibitor A domain-containing protein [Streptomyces dioscori]|uniref:immune inhibitor A domain-containing protein n=1 Tax=Streptomyces dioscori TaxID=2109333 RepID=UPI00131BD92A|nr:immune inhibitor A domain-containing protein [Streptomyces dioscori]